MSLSLRIVFSAVLTLSLGSAFACTEGENGCDAEKKEWLEYLKDELPRSFCRADSPFVQCSDVGKTQCRKIASSALSECLAELDKSIPPLLNRVEARERGEALGDCMGKKLIKAIKIQENKAPACAGLL